jgi:histone-lysine N-methyltransferase EZH2
MPIQNKIEKNTLIRTSIKAGYGLFAGEDIESGEFIIEYTGEFISDSEADKRGFFYDLKKISYLFDVIQNVGNENTTIDATRIGNNSRFVNHGEGEEVNVTTRSIMVDGQLKMCMFAAKDIKNGEELFFDYKYSCDKKNTHNMCKTNK